MKRGFGLLLLALACAGWWVDRPLFFACWLAAWWFFLGLMLGAMAIGCIHALSGGRWGEVLMPANRALQAPMPWLLLLFLPLLAGMHEIYPWLQGPQAGFARTWFSPPFVGVRLAVDALAWWLLTRGGEPAGPGRAAMRLMVWLLLTSLAAVDLLMSLTPGWTSSIFGWLTLTGQMSTGAAAATALAAMKIQGRDPAWRDLGNLLLMFVMLQAYLQFMQFLIIWAENLPKEISWYLPRLDTGWWMVGLSLILLQFAAPLLVLLWRANKDDPRRLARVAIGMLVMQAVGSAWLVVPSVQPHGYAAWGLLPLMIAGMGLLLFGHLLPARSPHAEPAYGRS